MQQQELHWKMTVTYFRIEWIISMIYISLSFFFSFVCYASVWFFQVNDYRLPINFYIIWLPFDGISLNWFLNYALQLSSIYSAIFLFTYFPIVLILINQTCWCFDVAIMHVKKLIDANNGTEAEVTRKKSIDEQLKKIFELTNQAMAWKDEIQSLFQIYFLFEFNVLSFLICMSVYNLSINLFGSIVGFVVLDVVTSQLFIYCWIGTRVTTRIEDFTSAIYDTNWYEMDTKQQKYLLLTLEMAQNMQGFNGVFSEVNLETFQKVLKSEFPVVIEN